MTVTERRNLIIPIEGKKYAEEQILQLQKSGELTSYQKMNGNYIIRSVYRYEVKVDD